MTDADVKVDRLYRAIAAVEAQYDPPPHDPYGYDVHGFSCSMCEAGDWERWDASTGPNADKIVHAEGCLYVEAVEYVTNNPGETQ